MRISRLISTTLAAVALAGGASLVAAANVHTSPSPTTVSLTSHSAQPAEDSPSFNCVKHGNRQCGVTLDSTPNNSNPAYQRYVITFNKEGQPVSVKPLGR